MKRNLLLTEGADLLRNWCLVQVPAAVTEDQVLGCCCGRNQGQRQFEERLYDPHSA